MNTESRFIRFARKRNFAAFKAELELRLNQPNL